MNGPLRWCLFKWITGPLSRLPQCFQMPLKYKKWRAQMLWLNQPEHLEKVWGSEMTLSPSASVMCLKYVSFPPYSRDYITLLPTILPRANLKHTRPIMIYVVADTDKWLYWDNVVVFLSNTIKRSFYGKYFHWGSWTLWNQRTKDLWFYMYSFVFNQKKEKKLVINLQ